jgi:hypothetical protein
VFLAACTSGPSEDDAAQVFIANYNANTWGLLRALHESPVTKDMQFTTNCPVAGSITITGDHSDRATRDAEFEIDSRLDACNFGNPGTFDPEWDAIVDGRVHWTSDGTTQLMDGFIHYRGHPGTFDCTVSLQMSIGETTRYAGTICDYDVQSDLGITP